MTASCRRLFCALVLGLVLPLPAAAEPVAWRIDPEHMSVGFLVDHLGFASVLGMFHGAHGSFVFDAQERRVEDITVTVEAASVHTNHKARDEHLRGRDFLWADRYPTITFVGRQAHATGERTGVISGELTLRGVTRPVAVEVRWNRTGTYPFGDRHEAIGLSARARIMRSDFGMDYGVAKGWVGDEVELIFEFEARRD